MTDVLARLEAGLGSPFERTAGREVPALVERLYGVRVDAVARLDTERDDTFRLGTDRGELLLKVANPADERAELDLQESAMRHVAEREPGIPVQRLVEPVEEPLTADGRRVRLTTFLPGTVLHEVGADEPQLRAEGRMLARLTRALADFEHPHAGRWHAWDLAHLAELAPLVPLLDEEHREPVAGLLGRFADETLPALAGTRVQVVHNDFNGGNLLADPADPGFIVGVLDFGDLARTFVAADVAVACCYAGEYLVSDDPWAATRAVMDGYRQRAALDDAEAALVPELVVARAVQRMLLGCWLAGTRPEDAAFLRRNVDDAVGQFERLRSAACCF